MEAEHTMRSPEEALAALEANEGLTLTAEARAAALKLEVGDELDLRDYADMPPNQHAEIIREEKGFSLRSGTEESEQENQ